MQITRNSLETLTGPSDCVFFEPGEHVTDEEYGATPAGVEHLGAG
jgi:hypothetical protein